MKKANPGPSDQQRKRLLGRKNKIRSAIMAGRDGKQTMFRAAIARAAVADLRRATGFTAPKARGRHLAALTADDPSATTPKLARLSNKGVAPKRYVRLSTFRNASGAVQDPSVVFSYMVRAKLRGAEKDRQPGLCRVIDPRTGEVVRTLDPFTRTTVEL